MRRHSITLGRAEPGGVDYAIKRESRGTHGCSKPSLGWGQEIGVAGVEGASIHTKGLGVEGGGGQSLASAMLTMPVNVFLLMMILGRHRCAASPLHLVPFWLKINSGRGELHLMGCFVSHK